MELQKGNVVHGFHLTVGKLLDAYNLIYDKMNNLVKEEIKRA